MGSLARRSGQPPRRAVRGARGRAGRRAGRVVSGGVARCAREAGAGRACWRCARDGRRRSRMARMCRCAYAARSGVMRWRSRAAATRPPWWWSRRGSRVGCLAKRRNCRAWARNGAIRRSCCRAISTGRGWTGWRRGMRSTWRDAFAARPLPGVLACRGARRRASARHASVTSARARRCAARTATDNPSAVNAGRRSPDASSCCITIRCCSTSAKTSSRSIWSCSGARCRSSVANSCAVSMLVPRWRLREMRAGEQQ